MEDTENLHKIILHKNDQRPKHNFNILQNFNLGTVYISLKTKTENFRWHVICLLFHALMYKEKNDIFLVLYKLLVYQTYSLYYSGDRDRIFRDEKPLSPACLFLKLML